MFGTRTSSPAKELQSQSLFDYFVAPRSVHNSQVITNILASLVLAC